VASATAAPLVNEGSTVALDGTGSSDPDGDPLTYQWTQTDGPTVPLTNATSAQASFVAPAVKRAGATLIFQLTVSDGLASASTSVTVSVADVNQPPSADAGPAQTVPEGTLVMLDGSGSRDPDGDLLTYQWTQTDGPAVPLDVTD